MRELYREKVYRWIEGYRKKSRERGKENVEKKRLKGGKKEMGT